MLASDTAWTEQLGNVGIAGHRDTFFRPLRNIRQDDLIALTTLRGEYHYRFVSTSVVTPRDVVVLQPTGEEVLTWSRVIRSISWVPLRPVYRAGQDGPAQPLESFFAKKQPRGNLPNLSSRARCRS